MSLKNLIVCYLNELLSKLMLQITKQSEFDSMLTSINYLRLLIVSCYLLKTSLYLFKLLCQHVFYTPQTLYCMFFVFMFHLRVTLRILLLCIAFLNKKRVKHTFVRIILKYVKILSTKQISKNALLLDSARII